MYNIVALIGEAGSGKDRLLQEIKDIKEIMENNDN